jgi:hypothetical protein
MPRYDNADLFNFITDFRYKKAQLALCMVRAEGEGNLTKRDEYLVQCEILSDCINACYKYDYLADTNPFSEDVLIDLIEDCKQFQLCSSVINNATSSTPVSPYSHLTWFEEEITNLSSGNTVTATHIPVMSAPHTTTINGLELLLGDDYTVSGDTYTFAFNFGVSVGGTGTDSVYISYYYLSS